MMRSAAPIGEGEPVQVVLGCRLDCVEDIGRQIPEERIDGIDHGCRVVSRSVDNLDFRRPVSVSESAQGRRQQLLGRTCSRP